MESTTLIAKTHPPEYLLHKYWARKPHNVLNHYIRKYLQPGDTVLDPFCGSGVFLAEARAAGMNVIGFDVNPIAFLISSVAVNPPNAESFIGEAKKLLGFANEKYRDAYQIRDNKPIRYVVHQILSKCSKCEQIGSIQKSAHSGSKYFCLNCNNRLSFNFENCLDTEVVKVIDRENNIYTDPDDLLEQKRRTQSFPIIETFNKSLLVNRRILAFPGMTLSNLFTPRAFALLSDLFLRAHQIDDLDVRNAILLFLTSGVAQCSRLIPYRNNLSTGGPAWTVPGFWIAPLHLETNPLIHLEARYRKFLKGIEALNEKYKNGAKTKVVVFNGAAQTEINNLSDNILDAVFFDPPYGDNVPYVEFSAIWNGFLKLDVDYQQEIVVSDRKEFPSSWDKYKSDIVSIIGIFHRKLKANGKVVMTFNNLDPRAWRIVLGAFSDYSFKCVEAKYQIPAVVSSKAQMASNTSYIGDYYCVFEKTKKETHGNRNFFELTERLKKVFYSRAGKVPRNLIFRSAILTILNENMDLDFVFKIEDAAAAIAIEKGDFFILRDELHETGLFNEYNLQRIVREKAFENLKSGRQKFDKLYSSILSATEEIGSPTPAETRAILEEAVLFEKEFCYLQKSPNQVA